MQLFHLSVLAFCASLLLVAVRCDGDLLVKDVDVNAEKSLVEKGKEGAQIIINLIRSDEFHKLLDLIGTVGGPIAGAVTSILKVLIGKNSDPSSSPDLQFMKQAFSEINAKLESFTHEFREIKNLIDWSTVQVSFGAYERSIRALKEQLSLLVNAPGSSIDDMSRAFIMKYESDYNNAAEKIHDAMVNTDLIFATNLLEASAKFTSNYRAHVQRFGMGLLQLLIQAVEIQIAYYDLKYNNEETSRYIKKVWDERFKVLENKMRWFDLVVRDRWTKQMPKDSDKYLADKRSLSNNDFAYGWYQFLNNKYNWRHWAVGVFDDVSGLDKYSYYYCSGYTSVNKFGRNIIAASVEKEATGFQPEEAKVFLEERKYEDKNAHHILRVINAADGQINTESCKNYRLKLVVEKKYGLKVGALTTRSHVQESCVSSFWGTTCYNIVVFG